MYATEQDIQWLTYSNTDTNKMVWKALTYSKLGEYSPHLNYHHRNGGTEVRLVRTVTSSGHSTRSTGQTCNGRTCWQPVYHTNALSCLASLLAAPSAENHICQTPPLSPANQYSVLWIEWLTLMLYQMQMSSAIYRWFSGSCHIKGPQCLQNIWYIFLTAIGVTPSGSGTVHIYKQYIQKHKWHK